MQVLSKIDVLSVIAGVLFITITLRPPFPRCFHALLGY